MEKEIKEIIKSHFDQSPIKNRIVKGRKIENYSVLSQFLALISLEQSIEKEFTKRMNVIKKEYKEDKLVEKIANNISEIELCGGCGKVVIMKICGGIGWWRKGVFQCGEINGRIASWCSKKCYEKRKNN